jgi:hypothetical protein
MLFNQIQLKVLTGNLHSSGFNYRLVRLLALLFTTIAKFVKNKPKMDVVGIVLIAEGLEEPEFRELSVIGSSKRQVVIAAFLIPMIFHF